MKHLKTSLLIIALLLLHLPSQAQTAIISHRGYWNTRGSAQNSLKALHNAYKVRGIYGVEIDVQLTKDSVLILSHDPDIGGYRIDKTNWEVLKNNVTLRSGERISTLDEFLAEFKDLPHLKMFLELKSQENSIAESYIAEKSIELIQKYDLTERIAFISFSLHICKELVKTSPESLIMHLRADLSPQELYDIGLRGVNYNYSVFWQHPEWYDQARELGMSVGAWTVNEPATMQYFILPRGFDFMTTDNIEPALDVFDLLDMRPREIDAPIR
ncbi:MAG: glycerophosphodiester phosphodiesterase family protein [Porphyromonas sp.]|nr:glycerophosphodiester phosphodiesterase family protein [Porphyromonas sp.]